MIGVSMDNFSDELLNILQRQIVELPASEAHHVRA
jgi:hypothetical protein